MRNVVVIAVVAWLGGLGPGRATAQCVEYQDYMHWSAGLTLRPRARDVAICGQHAIVAGWEGLDVVDLTDPVHPAVVDTLTLFDASNITVAGDRGCVYNSGDGLQLLDLADPRDVRLSGHIEPRSGAAFAMTHDLLFSLASEAVLRIFDIADLDQPRLVASLTLPGQAYAIAVAGDHAYLTCIHTFVVVDVAEPTAPYVAGSLEIADILGTVSIAGPAAYVVGDQALHVVDVSTPHAPRLVSTQAELTDQLSILGARAIALDENDAVQVVDLSDAWQPDARGRGIVAGFLEDAAIYGDWAVALEWEGDLHLFDISRSDNPRILGQEPGFMESATDVAVEGARAYVVSHGYWLRVFDVGDVGQPSSLGIMTTGGDVRQIVVEDALAYVVHKHRQTYHAGLQIVDVSKPTELEVIGSVTTPGDARGLALADDFAYVADGVGGLRVIDIADPRAPRLRGQAITAREAAGVAVQDGLAYVVGGGLQVIDVGDPDRPVVLGQLDHLEGAQTVVLSPTHAYIGCGTHGLQVVDIADPSQPRLVGWTATPGSIHRLFCRGESLYVADGRAGVGVFDIADPAVPRPVGYGLVPEEAVAVVVQGDYVFVADRGVGLQIMPSDCAPGQSTMPSRARAFPNPGFGAVSIRFAIPTDGLVQAAVFDLAGRRIRELPSIQMSAGSHDLRWDGHDDDGRVVPVGIYLVRITSPTSETTARVTMIR